MTVVANENIEFHDRSGGGWYCKQCEQYLHPDMVHTHACIKVPEWIKKHNEEAIRRGEY